LGAHLDIIEDEQILIFRTGVTTNKLDILCKCKEHFKMNFDSASPTLHTWKDSNRQQKFIESLLMQAKLNPLPQKRLRILATLTKSVINEQIKFFISKINKEIWI